MKRERVKTKRGFKGFGTFILGWFVGFICTIAILAGIGYWAYTSISVGKIEKWTKSDIAGKNEGVRDLTLKDVVAIAMGVSKGSNDYTLAKFEEDFGIKILDDTLYGISLDKLKNAPIKELGNAFDDTIDSATFNNVLSFMEVDEEDLGLLKTVLDSEITYYIVDGKLCTEEGDATTEVEFDYTIDGSTVEFSNGSHTISSGKITPRLSDLPLGTAVSKMSDATDDLKIYEVLDYTREGTEGNYTYKDNGVEVTGIMKTLAGYSVGDLSKSETFDGIYIYEVMGYTQEGSEGNYIYKDNGVEVTGVMSSLADFTIGELSNEDTFNGIYIYEIMGYTREGTEGNYTYKDGNVEVTGIMANIAGKTISELSEEDAFDDVTVADALNYTISGGKVYDKNSVEVTGVIKHLASKKVSNLSDEVQALTIGKILDVEEADATGVIKALYTSNLNTLKTDIEGLTVGKILNITEGEATGVIKALYNSNLSTLKADIDALTLGSALGVDEANAKGVVKTFYNTPIDQLASKIENIKIYEALGYTREGTEGNYTYKDENGNIVTGMIATLAPYSVNDLSNSNTFNNLYIHEVKGYYYDTETEKYYHNYDEVNGYTNEVTGIMGMIANSTLGNIQTSIQNIIDTKTVNELVDAGIITNTLSEKTKLVIGGKTITQLIDFINANIDLLVPTV